MEEVTIVGLDLAKRVFQVHCAKADGAVCFSPEAVAWSASGVFRSSAAQHRCNGGMRDAGYDDWQEEEIKRLEPLRDVSVGEILAEAIGIEPARWSRVDQMRVSGYLKKTGWERFRTNLVGGDQRTREWRYRR